MVERVHRYKEKEPLFERYGVEKEIASTLDRRVDLPSGGYLVFDYAEAFTVIDVNTGRFVGSRSKSSTQRLEDTITKNNLEAVKEVVRQLRLRDIGGIIVIDFIDMANPKNRAGGRGGAAHRARARPDEDLRRRDLAARARRDDAPERHRRPARDPSRGSARPARATASSSPTRPSRSRSSGELRALAAPGQARASRPTRSRVHPRSLTLLAGAGGARLAAIEEATRRRFFLVPADGPRPRRPLRGPRRGQLGDLQPDGRRRRGRGARA